MKDFFPKFPTPPLSLILSFSSRCKPSRSDPLSRTSGISLRKRPLSSPRFGPVCQTTTTSVTRGYPPAGPSNEPKGT